MVFLLNCKSYLGFLRRENDAYRKAPENGLSLWIFLILLTPETCRILVLLLFLVLLSLTGPGARVSFYCTEYIYAPSYLFS